MQELGTKKEVYVGEEEENIRSTKSTGGKVVNTKGECLLMMIEERGVYCEWKCEGKMKRMNTGPRGITVIDYGIINTVAFERTRIEERTELDPSAEH